MASQLLISFALLALLTILSRRHRSHRCTLPGPPGRILLGTNFGTPTTYPWFKFKDWADVYGPIYQVNFLGRTFIIVGSEKVANDLLRTRGSIYSDRHYITVMRGQIHLPLIGYGDTWRRQRKSFHHAILQCTASSPHYVAVLEYHVTRFLTELATRPEDWAHSVDGYIGGIVTQLAYGNKVQDSTDPIVSRIMGLFAEFELAVDPVHYAVNAFPILRHLPSWLAGYKSVGRDFLARERQHILGMHDLARQQMREGSHVPWSIARTYWENPDRWEVSDVEAAYTLGAFVEASLAGTPTTLKAFFLAMLHYPEWQEKIQEELDNVAPGRIPMLSDSPRMPLLRAVLKEVIRWRPTLPSGFPHRLTQDDTYEGYFVPKGALVLWHHWTMTRNSTTYPSPEIFNPSRFLDPAFPTYKAPLTKYPTLNFDAGFGFGRRMCPGTQMAEDMLFLAVGRVMKKFSIRRKKLDDGCEVEVPWYEYVDGMPTRLKGFEFDVLERVGRERDGDGKERKRKEDSESDGGRRVRWAIP